MRPLGDKRHPTHVAGHQDCVICHEDVKGRLGRARREDKHMGRGIRDEDNSEDEPHEIEDCEAVASTEKALKVRGTHPNDDGSEWIPLSQIHDDSEVYEDGHKGKLVVTAWFARKMGWI